MGASQTALGGEFGWLHVHDFPDKDETRIQAPGIAVLQYSPQDAFADADSWGYRLASSFTYNHDDELDYDDILEKRHINPALARYELHRVWVVEGLLKPGKKHIYSRRVFYLDEDSWQIAVTEAYDKDGALWRVAEGHIMNYYEVPLVWTTLEVYHDLKQRRYLVNGLDNQRRTYQFLDKVNVRTFSPNALDYYVR